jgi:polygalacturonase
MQAPILPEIPSTFAFAIHRVSIQKHKPPRSEQSVTLSAGGILWQNDDYTRGDKRRMGQPNGWFNVREHGAQGNGESLDTLAIQTTIDACAKTGGGTVLVPAGQYLTGAIFFRDNIFLHIDAGATLRGSENPDDYPVIASRWEGIDRETYSPLLSGSHLVNVGITGRGTVDGRGAYWWSRHRAKTLAYPRPRLIAFADCTNVLVENVTLTRSPSWTVNPIRCENVTVEKVSILNPHDSPNTDGINPDSCRNVHISNCHIDVGDDCIAIKSGVEAAGRKNLSPSENITITNCTMVHGHGGVVIGSEMSGSVRNVAISNCVFVGTDRGIRLKSRRGRGGVVEDIRVTNVLMQDVLCPFSMNLYYHIGVKGNREIADKRAAPVNDGTPIFRRIHFSHVSVHGAQFAAAFLYGLPEMPIADVSFDDVTISMSPDAQAGAPDMADGIEPMRRVGFFARNVRGLRLSHIAIENQIGEQLLIEDSTDVEIDPNEKRAAGDDTSIHAEHRNA